jgi:hypothetical protein
MASQRPLAGQRVARGGGGDADDGERGVAAVGGDVGAAAAEAPPCSGAAALDGGGVSPGTRCARACLRSAGGCGGVPRVVASHPRAAGPQRPRSSWPPRGRRPRPRPAPPAAPRSAALGALPPWRRQITLRGGVLGAGAALLFCAITLRLSLGPAGIVPRRGMGRPGVWRAGRCLRACGGGVGPGRG